jgi:hypothetical protein
VVVVVVFLLIIIPHQPSCLVLFCVVGWVVAKIGDLGVRIILEVARLFASLIIFAGGGSLVVASTLVGDVSVSRRPSWSCGSWSCLPSARLGFGLLFSWLGLVAVLGFGLCICLLQHYIFLFHLPVIIFVSSFSLLASSTFLRFLYLL